MYNHKLNHSFAFKASCLHYDLHSAVLFFSKCLKVSILALLSLCLLLIIMRIVREKHSILLLLLLLLRVLLFVFGYVCIVICDIL